MLLHFLRANTSVIATKVTIGNQNWVPSAQVAQISISKKASIEVKRQFCRKCQFGGFLPDYVNNLCVHNLLMLDPYWKLCLHPFLNWSLSVAETNHK